MYGRLHVFVAPSYFTSTIVLPWLAARLPAIHTL
jgi:hypothetical protein